MFFIRYFHTHVCVMMCFVCLFVYLFFYFKKQIQMFVFFSWRRQEAATVAWGSVGVVSPKVPPLARVD